MTPALLALLPFAKDILARVLPDPESRAKAELELQRLEQSGELARLAAETDLAKGQMAINATEAAHASIFVAGWRPAVGWTICAAMCFKYVAGPGVQTLARLAGHDFELPDIPAADLWPLLLAMLGVGPLPWKGGKP